MNKYIAYIIMFICTISITGCSEKNATSSNYTNTEISDNYNDFIIDESQYNNSEKAFSDKYSTINLSNIKKSDNIVLTDNVFMSLIQDINKDYNSYKDKTISYEGFLYKTNNEDSFHEDFAICRKSCYCGDDTCFIGLPVKYNNLNKFQNNDWVKVTGTLKIKDSQYGSYPYIEVTNISSTQPGNYYVF